MTTEAQAPALVTRALNFIEQDELTAWLTEHGLNVKDVVDVRLEIGRNYNNGNVQAWLDVTWLPTNNMGCRWARGDLKGAAEGHSVIPLRSWPKLTLIPDLPAN